jgi:hypothetical protein
VSSLVAKLQQDKLNFDNYFESEWKEDNGEYIGDAAQTAAFRSDRLAKQKSLQDSQKVIDSLDETWQNSNAVDCIALPWEAGVASETACSKPCGPGLKVQTRKYTEPVNGGQACPVSRETRTVSCNIKTCTRTVQAAQSTCAPGWTYRASDKKCTLVSQVPLSQGCQTGYTYNPTSVKCTKSGVTSIDPQPPSDYKLNTTLKQFEKTTDPTWSCATPGFDLNTGLFGTIYPPECVGFV